MVTSENILSFPQDLFLLFVMDCSFCLGNFITYFYYDYSLSRVDTEVFVLVNYSSVSGLTELSINAPKQKIQTRPQIQTKLLSQSLEIDLALGHFSVLGHFI